MLYTTDGTPYYLACLAQLGPTRFAEAFPGVTAEELAELTKERHNTRGAETMHIRKIGDWREENVVPGQDAGYYIEAVEIPHDQSRYAKISFREIEDTDLRRLSRGETIDFPLDVTTLSLTPEGLPWRAVMEAWLSSRSNSSRPQGDAG
jgi:hypothetical protein